MIPVMLVYFVVIAVVSVNQKSNKGLLSDSISHPHGYAVHSMWLNASVQSVTQFCAHVFCAATEEKEETQDTKGSWPS